MEAYIPEYKKLNIKPVEFYPDNSKEEPVLEELNDEDSTGFKEAPTNDLFSLKSGRYILFVDKQYIRDFIKQDLIAYLNNNIDILHDKDIFILKKVDFAFAAFIEE